MKRTIINSKVAIAFIFIAFFLLGVFLRYWQIEKESLRLDEAQSVWQASHSTEFIRTYMLKNVHLPLHNSLLHLWISYFGTEEKTVRMLALIPGVLALPAMYLLAYEIFRHKGKALFTLFLASTSPFWIWYSREIRMYTLLTLVTILSYLLFLKILRNMKLRYLFMYLLVNLVGIYTHYYFSLILIVQAIFFFASVNSGWFEQVSRTPKRVLAGLSAVAILLIAAFSPWVYSLIKSYGSGTYAPILPKPSSFNLVLSFFEFTFGYQPEHITSALIALWPLVIFLGFVFLTKREDPLRPPIYLALLGTFLPITVVFTASLLVRPMYLTRYLIISSPLYLIILTWLLTELKGKTRAALIIIFFTVSLLSLHRQYTSFDIPSKENYRDAVKFVEDNATERDILVISPAYTLYPVQYYYSGRARSTTMPIWDKRKGAIPLITPERLKADATEIQRGHQKIYLLVTLDLEGGHAVKSYYDLNYTKLDKVQFSKFVWVHVYQAEYETQSEVQARAKTGISSN